MEATNVHEWAFLHFCCAPGAPSHAPDPMFNGIRFISSKDSTHNGPGIEHTHHLIPSTTSRPPLSPKQTPIHPRHKLGMSSHSPQLSCGQQTPVNTSTTLSIPVAAPISPHPARHVVASTEQQIRVVRRPRHLPHRVLMTQKELQRAGGLTDVEGADHAVYACDGDDGAAIFVPVVG